MRILIAEDDFTSRSILTAILTKQNHTVAATVNGSEAWEAMKQPDAPRLAILDWMMPEMDGIEVLPPHSVDENGSAPLSAHADHQRIQGRHRRRIGSGGG